MLSERRPMVVILWLKSCHLDPVGIQAPQWKVAENNGDSDDMICKRVIARALLFRRWPTTAAYLCHMWAAINGLWLAKCTPQ
jgi:hypothetical protein